MTNTNKGAHMQPSQQVQGQAARQASDGFKSKFRQFHPLDRVWVKNPFTHDVVVQVADEYNRPFLYRLEAGRVSELPGGSIATLAVKAIVDELIQSNESEIMRIWEEGVRARHEDNIIVRFKQTTSAVDSATPGEINLTVPSDSLPEEEEPEQPRAPEQAFPGLNQPQQAPPQQQYDPQTQLAPPAPVMPSAPPLPAPVAQGIDNMIAASLPTNNKVLEDQG
jgi:hypothetical protein